MISDIKIQVDLITILGRPSIQVKSIHIKEQQEYILDGYNDFIIIVGNRYGCDEWYDKIQTIHDFLDNEIHIIYV